MTDVSELTSNGPGLGFGDDRGSCGGIYACALRAGCRNGALLAILNEGMLGSICNVACPSFYGLIRIFLVQQYGAHTKARAQSSILVGVSGTVMPDGPICVRPSLYLFMYNFASFRCHRARRASRFDTVQDGVLVLFKDYIIKTSSHCNEGKYLVLV